MRSSTHDVQNQAPPLVDFNPFDAYPALGEALVSPLGARHQGDHEALVASLVQFVTGRVHALST